MPGGKQKQNVGDWERIASLAGGVFLLWRGLTRRTGAGLTGAAVGVGLVYRGLSGYCAVHQALGINTVAAQQGAYGAESQTHAVRQITINQPAVELHRLWKSPGDFPRIHAHVADVEVLSDKLSHWKMRTPIGASFEWDSEIYEETPGEVIRWRSLPGAELENAGLLRFKPAPMNLGTEVTLEFRFTPPGGPVVRALSRALDSIPKTVVSTTLRKFKALAETGEIPTLRDNPSGRGGAEQGAQLAPAERSVAA